VSSKNAELVKRFKRRIGVKFESSGPRRLLKTVEVQVKFCLLIGMEIFAYLKLIFEKAINNYVICKALKRWLLLAQ
jgi:hypothetical protein